MIAYPGVYQSPGYARRRPVEQVDTAEKIVKTAEALIIERGYAGFSYQDVADRVGIRKPSIHHHFPSKAELGTAVISRYRRKMRQAWTSIDGDNPDFWIILQDYVTPMITLGRNIPLACTGGVLGGEFPNLPKDMQSELNAFFNEQENWLTALLEAGRLAGAFQFNGEPRAIARFIFSAVEGALLIKRARSDTDYFDDVLESINRLLGKQSP